MYKVLIADDEPKVSQLIKNLIQWEPLKLELVATAHDGITALEEIKRYRPDIVITDIRMPGYDGIELIRYAKEVNPNIDFIIVSGYQHFDYAHNAIKYGVKDYLLKPLNKNEINAALAKMIERYKEVETEKFRKEQQNQEELKRKRRELLEQLYEGKAPSENAAEIFGGREGASYQALVLKPDFEYPAGNPEAMAMLLGKLSKIAEQSLREPCTEFGQLTLGDRVFVVAGYLPENKKSFRKALNHIIDECHLFRDIFPNLLLTIGAGGVREQIADISLSAAEAKEALLDRLIAGGGKICPYSAERHASKPSIPFITLEDRKKLIELVEASDIAQIHGWIRSLRERMVSAPGLTGRLALETLQEMKEMLFFALKNHVGIEAADSNADMEFQRVLDMQNNLVNAFAVLDEYATQALERIVELRKSENNRPVKEVQRYISKHYAAAISLEEVSSMAGFNATYFSTLFKKETGMNFLEYVTSVRIGAAKKLLGDTQRSIMEISHEVGYNDFKHFTKQFKKVTNLSPSEYRKLYY